MHKNLDQLHLHLVWVDPSTDQERELTTPLDFSETITIGSDDNNTIVLKSAQVSRRHAKLESMDGEVVITDLKSTNQTLVNGEAIEAKTATPLKNGDSFIIRPVAFTVGIQAFSAQLVVRWSKAGGQQYEDTVDLPISLGRDEKNSIVLPDEEEHVSRHHATIEQHGDQLVLIDGSFNGTYVNEERYKGEQVTIERGDKIQIGEYTIKVAHLEQSQEDEVSDAILGVTKPIPNATQPISKSNTQVIRREESMLAFDQKSDLLGSIPQPVAVLTSSSSISLPKIFRKREVPFQTLQQVRMPLQETTYLAIGGGLGSFAWVDHLVICGTDPKQIVALGFPPKAPYGRYQQLCRHSQIRGDERLRSNSDSCPDNVWGWPGYAVREIWQEFKEGDFGRAGQMAWQIFNEPLAETYTPRSQDVFASIDREAARIGWDDIWRAGRVEAIRKTDDGRYVVAYSQPQENRQHATMLMVADYVHLSVGYPGVRFLPDLVAYRKRTGDNRHVVNAYEQHEHLYKHLATSGGTVIIRGRGIVASRIIQRLFEVRDKRLRDKKKGDIRILHLMRTPKPEGYRFGHAQRVVEQRWEFQPFNWPKGTWGGAMRVLLERADDLTRDKLLTDWGGTTTASRHDWRTIIDSGLGEGWYEQQIGTVERVEWDAKSGKVVTRIRSSNIERQQTLLADFIIDATGLDAKLDSNPLLNDLMQHYKLERNPKGRLKVANDFEIVGMRHRSGRIYAAGVMTLGGPYAPVDTFLGLQYAALRSVDALSKLKAPGLKKLNGIRSIWQWIKWARGVKP